MKFEMMKKESPLNEMESQVMAGCYCSLPCETEEDKVKIYNVSQSSDHRLRECINMEIEMQNLFIELVELSKKDENGNDTGETVISPRIVIIDVKGETYSCCSSGIYLSLKRICGLYGMPNSWEHPITIIPVLISSGKNQVLSIRLK